MCVSYLVPPVLSLPSVLDVLAGPELCFISERMRDSQVNVGLDLGGLPGLPLAWH